MDYIKTFAALINSDFLTDIEVAENARVLMTL